MTLKLSTLIIGSALAAGTVTAICFGVTLQRNSQLLRNSLPGNVVKIEKAARCKYMYDEMAHKLVAYSSSETSANQNGFSRKLGSRILELTKDVGSEQQIITL
ncbi:hypothetical protein [Dyadobacter psychrophilus]|uniref:Uncharacterized protein n=1 Tax=Dyadobacter psychrophilus TaxID=651661 RepID=A0A1T5DS40_9BACT|nr:hypothetical protein [Dyadobacter psychrophilus]SKB74567.1 hypothetical protein SAMN05660293_01855 [Dyadobacter psychrophilus]